MSSLAGIISLGLANLTVLSEIKKRRSAQNDLMELNEGLERNIEHRTLELKRANEKLLEVGLERESILYSEKEARMEAEIANRLRDEFMATVSHELRTPLNSILGWARMMKGGSLDDSQVEKALTTIIKNSETQTRLIEDLLDVARIISGKLQLKIVDLHPGEIVSEAIETVRPAAGHRNMAINLHIEPKAQKAVIEGDLNRLVQVFTNLLGNAIKFSPEGAAIDVDVAVEDSNARVSIRDPGKGIKAEFLPLVFERFRQDAASESRNGGLGLGLAIVRNLVEMHHGSVRAESEGENEGSTFTVLLPLNADQRTEVS
jgi:signal transduction histidine kinase